jgi:hypothetical protein
VIILISACTIKSRDRVKKKNFIKYYPFGFLPANSKGRMSEKRALPPGRGGRAKGGGHPFFEIRESVSRP